MKNNESITRQFKRKRTIQDVILVLIFAALFGALWLSNNRDYLKDDSIRLAVTMAICTASIGGLLFYYLNWRCPSCRKYMGRQRNPQKCPRCGVRLQ